MHSMTIVSEHMKKWYIFSLLWSWYKPDTNTRQRNYKNTIVGQHPSWSHMQTSLTMYYQRTKK